MKNRKRVTFTTERDTWAHCNEMLKEKGYPLGAMGYYLTNCLHNLEEQLANDTETQLMLFTLGSMKNK